MRGPAPGRNPSLPRRTRRARATPAASPGLLREGFAWEDCYVLMSRPGPWGSSDCSGAAPVTAGIFGFNRGPDGQRSTGGRRPLRPSGATAEQSVAGFVAFAGLGLQNALCLAGGLIGGVFLDRALGTRPLFIFLGMFAGIALGVLVTRAAWKRYF